MLVGAVAIATGGITAGHWAQRFAEFSGYARMPANGMLERICRSFMTVKPIEDMAPGDVVMMRFKKEPHHLAIVGDHPAGGLSLIHALADPGYVTEHGLDKKWGDRVLTCFSMPGVA
jgi:hypothetical protein